MNDEAERGARSDVVTEALGAECAVGEGGSISGVGSEKEPRKKDSFEKDVISPHVDVSLRRVSLSILSETSPSPDSIIWSYIVDYAATSATLADKLRLLAAKRQGPRPDCARRNLVK